MRTTQLLVGALAFAFDFAAGATYSNPLREENGSDPFIAYSGGYYYLMTTTWTDIQITRATTLAGLTDGETKVVYQDSEASRCCNLWAPEVHFLDGKWWIYYTAGNDVDLTGQKMHVLEGMCARSFNITPTSSDLLTGGETPFDDYSYGGQLLEEWSIDGSILRVSDKKYLTYSCQREGRQSLCLAEMNSPTSVGTPAILTVPTESWETQGEFPVAEGPVALYHENEIYIVYTGSQCWSPDYQLGYLRYDGSGDPLSTSSWSKTGPVFSSANGNFGTGHNGCVANCDS